LQAKGSLKETALRSLLEGAQTERATGTLTVKNNGAAYTLYFLFGHLFHASGEGTPAMMRCSARSVLERVTSRSTPRRSCPLMKPSR